METAKLQYTESGQTVCLPSGYSIPGNEAGIVRRGSAIVIFPVDTPWRGLFDSLDKFSPDFMSDREQFPLQACPLPKIARLSQTTHANLSVSDEDQWASFQNALEQPTQEKPALRDLFRRHVASSAHADTGR